MRKMTTAAVAGLMAAAAAMQPALPSGLDGLLGRKPDPKRSGFRKGRRFDSNGRRIVKEAGNPAGTKLGKKAEKARTSRRFADTFLASLAAKRITKAKLRDENGAYTLTGRNGMPGINDGRRKWLGGYSERRGY